MAVQPPAPATLAAAPHVGHRVHEATVQQARRPGAELGPFARFVSAVPVQQAGRGAIARQPLAVGDGHRDQGPVSGRRGDALAGVPGRIVTGHGLPLAELPPASGQVHVVPGRRVDKRLGPHGHRGRPVVLVHGQGQRDVPGGCLDQPLVPRPAVHDAQLGRRPAALLHHQVPPEHIAADQAGVRGPGDDLGPARPARRAGRGPDQPELLRPGVRDQEELAPARAVAVIGPVFVAALSFLQDGRWPPGITGRQDKRLRGVPGGGLDEHVRPAASGPHGEVETLVLLAEHQGVPVRRGVQLVAPDLVRAVLGIGDDVEQRSRVGRPGQAVIGAVDTLGQVRAAGQIADPQLVGLVTVEVDRVGQQPPVRADLTDPEGDIAAGAGRIPEQEVLVQEHPGRGPAVTSPAELLEFAARDRPGEVGVAAAAPAD